jgi:hypothetical protein
VSEATREELVMAIPDVAIAHPGYGLLWRGMSSFGRWLHEWQTLVAAGAAVTVASIAAYFAYRNLRQTQAMETNRRARKHAATRAILPLALAQVSGYAESSARSLKNLIGHCDGETLPMNVVGKDIVQTLPDETLGALAEFIEFADQVDAKVLEAALARIQIHDSRLQGVRRANQDVTKSELVTRSQIEGLIVDAAIIYGAAVAVLEYARRMADSPPTSISWDQVRRALRNMRLWDDENPRLFDNIKRREGLAGDSLQFERPILSRQEDNSAQS